jgi:hypothetical protein
MYVQACVHVLNAGRRIRVHLTVTDPSAPLGVTALDPEPWYPLGASPLSEGREVHVTLEGRMGHPRLGHWPKSVISLMEGIPLG